MKRTSGKQPSPQQMHELTALAQLPDASIDTSDIPEVHDWSGAERGLFYRPVKRQLTLRLDADTVAWFKSHVTSDEGYQTRINRVLREYAQRHGKRAPANKAGDRAKG